MEPRQFIVGLGENGNRIDRWLSQKMPELSRGQIKHLIDQGKVLVNHRRILIAGWELEPQDSVEVRIPAQGMPEIHSEMREETTYRRDRTEPKADKGGRRFLEVIFEDRDIIVVDKPAGVLTEPKEGSPHDHLLGMIKGYLKRKFKDSRGSYVKLLHRLDRDTSGVVVAAKSKVGEQLEGLFRAHRVERHYVAIVEGRIEKEEGKINLSIEKGDFEGGKKARVVAKGAGMEAITYYRVKERYTNATLVDIRVETGRTHQVRIHFAELGHPLIGDKIYGATQIRFPRHALHASLLGFHHPHTKKFERYETKLPQDMENLIDQLRGS